MPYQHPDFLFPEQAGEKDRLTLSKKSISGSGGLVSANLRSLWPVDELEKANLMTAGSKKFGKTLALEAKPLSSVLSWWSRETSSTLLKPSMLGFLA